MNTFRIFTNYNTIITVTDKIVPKPYVVIFRKATVETIETFMGDRYFLLTYSLMVILAMLIDVKCY